MDAGDDSEHCAESQSHCDQSLIILIYSLLRT